MGSLCKFAQPSCGASLPDLNGMRKRLVEGRGHPLENAAVAIVYEEMNKGFQRGRCVACNLRQKPRVLLQLLLQHDSDDVYTSSGINVAIDPVERS